MHNVLCYQMCIRDRVGETLLDISTIDSVRRQIAWIPQELALPFEWVKEMVLSLIHI